MSLDFGVVLQTDPPAQRVIDLAKRAEAYGFTHAWTFDSHLLWEEPFVIYSRILNETAPADRRPDGHQPGDARLDGDRVAVRDAQRDVRQPHRVRDRPRRLGGARDQRQARAAGRAARGDRRHPRPRQRRARSTTRAPRCAWPGTRTAGWRSGSRPTARRRSRSRARSATASSSSSPTRRSPSGASPPCGARPRRPASDPDAVTICVAAPAYVTDGSDEQLAHAREQCRWFGGMVGNHVADIVARYGADGGGGPEGADRLHRGPRGLRLQRARQGRQHAHAVRARLDRRPLLPHRPARGARRASCGSSRDLGADQFALYLQHDAKDATLARYGELVIPEVNQREAAKT